jgi:carboxyl-terminal processing protease
MKRSLISVILAMVVGLCALPLVAKTANPGQWDYLQPGRDQVIASLNTVELLQRHHYSNAPLDDARSEKIYAGYLKMLDPARSYFTAADIAEFDRWKDSFDDLLKKGDLGPGFYIYIRQLERQQSRLHYALNLIDKGLDSIDFTLEEDLLVDRENAPWAKNVHELDDLWRKRVKDEVLRLKLAGKPSADIQSLLSKRYKAQLARLQQTRSEDVTGQCGKLRH